MPTPAAKGQRRLAQRRWTLRTLERETASIANFQVRRSLDVSFPKYARDRFRLLFQGPRARVRPEGIEVYSTRKPLPEEANRQFQEIYSREMGYERISPQEAIRRNRGFPIAYHTTNALDYLMTRVE